MGNGGNNIVRTQRRITTEEDLLVGRLEGGLVENGNFPLIELDAQVSLYPWKAILLADGAENIVTG